MNVVDELIQFHSRQSKFFLLREKKRGRMRKILDLNEYLNTKETQFNLRQDIG